jgi:uncharacterized protein (DUF433 family)
MATNAQPVNQKHIELRTNRDGRLRAYVTGTRVRVQDVYVDSEIRGKTPDEIVVSLPHLSLAQVHAALAYSFDNRDAILAELREDGISLAEIKAKTGSGPLERMRKGTGGHGDSVSS